MASRATVHAATRTAAGYADRRLACARPPCWDQCRTARTTHPTARCPRAGHPDSRVPLFLLRRLLLLSWGDHAFPFEIKSHALTLTTPSEATLFTVEMPVAIVAAMAH